MNKLLEFLVHSNIYLSLGAASVAYMSMVLFEAPVLFEPIFISFAVTFFLYNLNRKTDLEEDRINYPERVEFVNKNINKVLSVGAFLYLVSLGIASVHSIWAFFIVIAFFMLVFFYSVLRMKKILFLKNLIVASGWGLIPILVGTYLNLPITNSTVLAAFLFIFLRLIINTIIFDTRDVIGDSLADIDTLPRRFGIENIKIFLFIVNTISLFFIILVTYMQIFPAVGYVISSIAIYGYIIIYLINKIPLKILCEAIDGEFILLGLVAFLGSLVM